MHHPKQGSKNMLTGSSSKSITFTIALLALEIAASGVSLAATADNILADFSFDDGNLASGPDSFMVFEYAKGSVLLNNEFVFSGSHSVEIRDVAGDGDFPELQGYFPVQRNGILHFHFSMLLTGLDDDFHLALAGPRNFEFEKDGIAFWMALREGEIWQYSQGRPKTLFQPQTFTWYHVDVSYDIEAGIYDLVMREEHNPDPIIELFDQPNVISVKNSAINKFSFAGDIQTNLSNAVYYIDDILVTTSEEIFDQKLIAPGRRRLFMDHWLEIRRNSQGELTCLPLVAQEDILNPDNAGTQVIQGASLVLLGRIVAGEQVGPAELEDAPLSVQPVLQAMTLWKQGCQQLENKSFEQSLASFSAALALAPESRLFAMAEILALAGTGDWEAVDLKLLQNYGKWTGNDRFDVMVAMLGFARRDLNVFYDWWETSMEQAPADLYVAQKRQFLQVSLRQTLVGEVNSGSLPDWYEAIQPYLIAEQYYDMLLFSGSPLAARQFALEMVDHLRANTLPELLWQEKVADAAFMLGAYDEAEKIYREIVDVAPILGKLSDVYFMLGNVELERAYREIIYGSLTE